MVDGGARYQCGPRNAVAAIRAPARRPRAARAHRLQLLQRFGERNREPARFARVLERTRAGTAAGRAQMRYELRIVLARGSPSRDRAPQLRGGCRAVIAIAPQGGLSSSIARQSMPVAS